MTGIVKPFRRCVNASTRSKGQESTENEEMPRRRSLRVLGPRSVCGENSWKCWEYRSHFAATLAVIGCGG